MEDMISTGDVKKLLNVSGETVRRLIKSGELQAIRVTEGGHYRILRRSLESYLEKQNFHLVVEPINK